MLRLSPRFLLIIAALVGGIALSQPSQAQFPKQVWAFYMSFWTLDSWEATSDVLTDYPQTRYSSTSPSAVTQHIRQAQNAGIDAFIVNWFGIDDTQTTLVLNNMLNQAAANNFQIGVALDSFPIGVNRSRDAVTRSLAWLIENRTSHPAYLRFDGKPVIYFAFQENTGLSSAAWNAIRDEVDPNRQTIWVAEGLNGCCIHNGAFDGMYAFNLAWGDPATTASRQFRLMQNAGGYFYTPTVHPGWDESLIAERDNRPNPTSPRARNDGRFLRQSWDGAVASGAGIILIVSWNEYMENSHIEPSVQYGRTSLDTLQPLIRDWKAGRTSPPLDPVSDEAEASDDDSATSPSQDDTSAETGGITPLPAGSSVVINVTSMNVRAAPTTDSEIVASVFQGESYEALGQIDGWYQIRINQLEGYIWAEFATLR